jgi:ferric-dicitrate binding protein FerR (iron transport regulator)
MISLGESMDPTTDIKQTRDALFSRAEEQLAHAYEQIKSADEQLARMEAQLPRQEREAPRSHSRRSRDRPWLRGLAGLLLAAYIVAAAVVSQSSNGDAVARWAPQLVSVLTQPLEKLVLFSRPNPSSVHLAVAEPAAPALILQHDITPTAFPVSPEPAKLLQTMARDLASVEREIEQLKAGQQQLASENAKAIEQTKAIQEQAARDIARNVELLKASQEQVTQLIARASEQSLRPRTPVPQPHVAIGARKPAPTPVSSHASVHPQTPMQLRPEQR